jgi:hypothetical protein
MAAISNFLFRHLTFLLLLPFYNPNTINLHVLMVLSIGDRQCNAASCNLQTCMDLICALFRVEILNYGWLK